VVTTAGNGAIVLRTTAGNITLNDGTALADNTAVSANGSGNILLQAIGATSSITGNADVITATGHLSILAAQDLTFHGRGGHLDGGRGLGRTIDLVAGTGTIQPQAPPRTRPA